MTRLETLVLIGVLTAASWIIVGMLVVGVLYMFGVTL